MPASPTALDRLVSPDGRPTLGLELPLDNDWGATRLRTDQAAGRPFGVPDLTEHARIARLADSLGFAALWVRDVPLHDPGHFGDAGSVFETFTHLGRLAAVTERAVLGTAAVVLPLRQPLLVAKAATVDVLSGGRFVLGLASGDRPVEYPLSSERTSTLVDGLSATTSGPARRLGHARAWRGTRAALPRSRRRPTARRPARAHRPDGPACHRRKRPADAEWVAENAEASLDHPRPLGALGLKTREWRALTIEAPRPSRTSHPCSWTSRRTRTRRPPRSASASARAATPCATVCGGWASSGSPMSPSPSSRATVPSRTSSMDSRKRSCRNSPRDSPDAPHEGAGGGRSPYRSAPTRTPGRPPGRRAGDRRRLRCLRGGRRVRGTPPIALCPTPASAV